MQINEDITPERYRRIVAIFEAACEHPTKARAAFLDEACAGDEALRREVEEMLAHDASAGKILDQPAAGLVRDSTATAWVGSQLGPYRIEGVIGEGGMGVVYKALDVKLNRPAAIKFIHDDLADVAARRRFQREAKMASSLNHPHIVTVYDAGEFDGRQYLVTEFVDGGTLQDWGKAEKRSWRQVVELLVGVADALASAHAVGMTHRDIKPANILVAKNGYAKLADFGLAKLAEIAGPEQETRTLTDRVTRPGVIVGTIAYMSPEQASSKPVDARSDIFSFGVVMYELLAGRRPFTGDTELELLQTIIHGAAQPLPEEIPASLRMVIEKALEKAPEDRYQSMREMVVDLRRLTRQSGEAYAPRREHSRLLRWAGAGMALLIAGGAAVMLFRPDRSARTARLPYMQLTNFDFAVQPALSPDGHMMAFVHGPETGVAWMGSASEIFVKILPGGDPVQLTHDGLPNKFAPRFSPDGTRVAYSTLGDPEGWTTWVVPVLGGQPPRKLLTNAEGLSWIPPRTTGGTSQPLLLFSYMTGRGITMAVASSTESRSEERTVFMEDGIMDHFSQLSPDGQQLLLVEMGFNGWQPCRVAPFDGSSKGKKVGPQQAQCDAATWSPDGKWMYFSADTGGGFHVWRQRFPDGPPEQVTSGTSEQDGIEFSPDGRSFLTSIGTIQTTLWIHDAHGDRQVSYDAYTFSGSFSSDGKKLYYLVRTKAGTTNPYGGLWIMDLESEQRQRLLPDFEVEQYEVSSDGKRVVFVSPAETAQSGVWLAATDGSSAPRQLSSRHGEKTFFGASGDVFFTAQEQDGTFLYRVNESGGDSRRVIPFPIFSLYGVSPDGKYLAVWGGPTQASANTVAVYPVEGGPPTIVCKTCGFRSNSPPGVRWSADEKLVYFAAMGGQAVFSIPLHANDILPALPSAGLRSVQEMAALPGATPLPKPFAVAGPNPSVYVYPKFTTQRNIYRVPVP